MVRPFRNKQGVTLIETLLVLVVVSLIIGMLISYMQRKADSVRRSRVSLQMQEILNAAAAYYVANNKWPKDLNTLRYENYLPPPSVAFKNPWGKDFTLWIKQDALGKQDFGMLYVYTDVLSSQNAIIVSGTLPLSFVSDAGGAGSSPPTQGGCASTAGDKCSYVVTSINVPGQALNKARAASSVSVYRNGACVPAPDCPGGMVPEIYVVPVEAYGAFEKPNCTDINDPKSCVNAKIIPINRYSGYAIGPVELTNSFSIRDCQGNTNSFCMKVDRTIIRTGKYWRVCLAIESKTGLIQPDNAAWGKLTGSVAAMTRCVPADASGKKVEPIGSSFNVWWY